MDGRREGHHPAVEMLGLHFEVGMMRIGRPALIAIGTEQTMRPEILDDGVVRFEITDCRAEHRPQQVIVQRQRIKPPDERGDLPRRPVDGEAPHGR